SILGAAGHACRAHAPAQRRGDREPRRAPAREGGRGRAAPSLGTEGEAYSGEHGERRTRARRRLHAGQDRGRRGCAQIDRRRGERSCWRRYDREAVGVSSEKKPGFWQRLFGIGAQEPPKEEPAPPKPARKEPPAPRPAQKEPPEQKQAAQKAAELKA